MTTAFGRVLQAAVLVGLMAGVAHAGCSYDAKAELALAYDAFDEGAGGWRVLANRDDSCKGVAADLIAAYRTAHWATLTRDQRSEVLWHEGQTRAWRGDYRRASALMRQSRDLLSSDDGIGRRFYDDATIAFLERDHIALRRAKAALEAMPEPAWNVAATQRFVAKYHVPAPTWPVNHDVVDSLDACFERPYSEAYALSCHAKPAP
ncbi:MAG TPA: hypothetical protein VKQ70_02830 [Caulobacteraceae bacterium]|jgi:hypothetical protein|nr:hypothetical protein [Caulobacteraceae bacterium]